MIKLALIKEGKTPADSRVVLTPKQCKHLKEKYTNIKIVAQKSDNRCFSNEEYQKEGIELVENVNDCDILIGVKEVLKKDLIADKTYFFFSHTIKKQPYNKALLQKVLAKNIRLVDYECLKKEGQRIIAFGRWAGIVGAYNGLFTYAKKYKNFDLPRAKDSSDYNELKQILKKTSIPPIKIVITGNGRVALGAIEVMEHANIKKVTKSNFLNKTFDEPVYVQLDCDQLYKRKADNGFVMNEFFKNPELYYCDISDITKASNLFINAIYWNPKAPAYFTLEDMQKPDFNIKVIADITCDIAPEASLPSTIKASTIADPVFGFDTKTLKETAPFLENTVDIMSIDNLPNELPKDASQAFGEMFIDHILEELIKPERSEILYNATIARNGELNLPFAYLGEWVNS